jgi:excisionase family DNA binding protein
MTTSRVLSKDDAASALNVSLSTIDRMIKSGDIKAKKNGRRVVIMSREIDRVLKGLPEVKKPRRKERRATTATRNAKQKRVSIDADVVDTLDAIADGLEPQLGFRPTLSQTLRNLIKQKKGAGR